MEVKNRRENLYIGKIPPVIPDGIVTNTDYATADTAGVIKYNNTIGTTVNSSGVLTGITRTEAQYASGGNGMLICKGTLENIIAGLITKVFAAEADPTGEAADGTKWNFSLYKQTGEYIWTIEQIIP